MVSDNLSMLTDATITKTRKMVILALTVLLVAVIAISLSLSIPKSDHETLELNNETTSKNPKPNSFHEYICGRRYFKHRQKRIVGGIKAQAHAWPWQVFFKKPVACGATILTRSWIITAAHCLHYDNGTFYPISKIKVVLGEHNRRTKKEDFPSEERSIAQAIVHQGYNPVDDQSDFDLALLRLDSPIDFQPNIIPICLPTNDDEFSGLTGTVTGWGRIKPDIKIKPSLLRQLELPILSNKNCASMTEWRITNNSLCAGYKNGGKDFCSGDSGGPLAVKDSNDRYVLAGVVSGGPCAQPAGPGIYMRVSRFLHWITNHTDY